MQVVHSSGITFGTKTSVENSVLQTHVFPDGTLSKAQAVQELKVQLVQGKLHSNYIFYINLNKCI